MTNGPRRSTSPAHEEGQQLLFVAVGLGNGHGEIERQWGFRAQYRDAVSQTGATRSSLLIVISRSTVP